MTVSSQGAEGGGHVTNYYFRTCKCNKQCTRCVAGLSKLRQHIFTPITSVSLLHDSPLQRDVSFRPYRARPLCSKPSQSGRPTSVGVPARATHGSFRLRTLTRQAVGISFLHSDLGMIPETRRETDHGDCDLLCRTQRQLQLTRDRPRPDSKRGIQ